MANSRRPQCKLPCNLGTTDTLTSASTRKGLDTGGPVSPSWLVLSNPQPARARRPGTAAVDNLGARRGARLLTRRPDGTRARPKPLGSGQNFSLRWIASRSRCARVQGRTDRMRQSQDPDMTQLTTDRTSSGGEFVQMAHGSADSYVHQGKTILGTSVLSHQR